MASPLFAFGSTSHLLPAVDEYSGVSGVAPAAKNRMFLGEYRQCDRTSKDARFFEAPWQRSTAPDVPHSAPSGRVT